MFNSEILKLEESVLDHRRNIRHHERRVEQLEQSLASAKRAVDAYQHRLARDLAAIDEEKAKNKEILASVENWTKLSKTGRIEDIRTKVAWGTFGKSGKDPLKYVLLCDLTIEHIEAVLATQAHIGPDVTRVFYMELGFRAVQQRKIAKALQEIAEGL